MRAGRLSERVEIQRAADGAVDGYGQQTRTWETHATLWGDLRETRGKEAIEADRLDGLGKATLRLRYSTLSAAITAKDRVVARGFTWAIVSPAAEIERRRTVELVLERGGPVGVDVSAGGPPPGSEASTFPMTFPATLA